MTDKSISEQLRDIQRQVHNAELCSNARKLGALADKVEALERELKATHIYLADEKRRREEAERRNREMHKLITELEDKCLYASDYCPHCDINHDLIEDWRNDDHRGN